MAPSAATRTSCLALSNDFNNDENDLERKDISKSSEEIKCGWFCFTPPCLQRFLTSRWLLVVLCWACATQGMVVSGFINVIVTTIERRFSLSSTDTGLIVSMYDIASFACLIPISYFGGMGKKSRWLGWGVFVVGLGSFMFAIPQFTTGKYAFILTSNENMCDVTNRTARDYCHEEGGPISKLSNYKYVFIFAQILHGIGSSPLYTLGVTFLDESVSTEMSSLYVGIYYSMSCIGPAIGYILGGEFLRMYVDISTDPASLGITPSSKVWVGAWWIGFLVSGCLTVIIAIPLLAFPAELPATKSIQAAKVSEAHQQHEKVRVSDEALDKTQRKDSADCTAHVQINMEEVFSDLPTQIKSLLSNPTFMFLNFASAAEAFLVNGMAAFLPKFIEWQYGLSASLAAVLVGLVTVPGAGGGTFIGGYIVQRFGMRCSSILKYCICCAICSWVCTLCFLLTCPSLKYAGINTAYSNSSSYNPDSISLDVGECASDCGCSLHLYDPVCGADSVTYYSPCLAGCKKSYSDGGTKVYGDCSCIDLALVQRRNLTAEGTMVGVMATKEKCQNDCGSLPTFTVFGGLLIVLTFLVIAPSTSATLRCIETHQRSLGLGLQLLFLRIFGAIPSPIVLGKIMDMSCILWEDNCGEFGACRAYNNSKMSWYILAVSLVVKGCTTFCFFMAWFHYNPPTSQESGSKRPISINIKHSNHYGSNGASTNGHLAKNAAAVLNGSKLNKSESDGQSNGKSNELFLNEIPRKRQLDSL